MKLGPLNAAIRKLSGAPKTNLRYAPDGMEPVELVDLEITKASLLSALKKQFPNGGKALETGLRIKDTGHLVAVEGDEVDEAQAAADSDDLDDLLG